MKNYIVQEVVTICYAYQVCASNEEEAIAKIKDNYHEEGRIPEYDSLIDVSYAAGEACVLPQRLPKFQM